MDWRISRTRGVEGWLVKTAIRFFALFECTVSWNDVNRALWHNMILHGFGCCTQRWIMITDIGFARARASRSCTESRFG